MSTSESKVTDAEGLDLSQFCTLFSPPIISNSLPAPYESSGSFATLYSSVSSSGELPDVYTTFASLGGIDNAAISARLDSLSIDMKTVLNALAPSLPSQPFTKDMFIRQYKVCGQMLPFIIDTTVSLVYLSFPLSWPSDPSSDNPSPLSPFIRKAIDLITLAHLDDCPDPPEGK
jgi:hypothetical protein